MLPVLVVRPEPGAAASVAAARTLGLEARAYPLFAVRALEWEPAAPGDVDALLLGSANAVRHGGPALELYRGLPAYAVGEKTSAAAREAGFEVMATGKGGLQDLLGRLEPGHKRLLRLAGRERVPLVLPEGAVMTTREVYASEPLPLPRALVEALARPAVVLLHSGEAAAHLDRAMAEAGIPRAHLRLAAIGPRVATRAGTGWAALASAPSPDDTGLLALAREMCQETWQGSEMTDKSA